MKGVSREFVNKVFIVAVFAFAVLNFGLVISLWDSLVGAFRPLLIGAIVAIIVNIPLTFFEKKVFKKAGKLCKPLSLASACVLVVGVVIGLGFLILPQVIVSIKEIVSGINVQGLWDDLSSRGEAGALLAENGKKLIDSTVSRLQEFLPDIIAYAQGFFKSLINFFLGVFFALMILANKEELKRQSKKLLHKLIKKEQVLSILDGGALALEKFSRFLGGQVIEAVILGFVCYLFMKILNLPYAALISVITGVANLVPIVGAYAGGAMSAILIFAVSPPKALIFIIFIVVLQQVESVTTYPVIVGRYVGLSGFWILTAVVIGGGLFGIWGVFLGVPVTAFLHDFIAELIRRKPFKTTMLLP